MYDCVDIYNIMGSIHVITTDSALLHLLAEPEGDGDGSHHGVSCHGVFLWGQFISIQDSSSYSPLELVLQKGPSEGS